MKQKRKRPFSGVGLAHIDQDKGKSKSGSGSPRGAAIVDVSTGAKVIHNLKIYNFLKYKKAA
jgi:hypothetical protein